MKFMRKVLAASVLTLFLTVAALAEGVIGTMPPNPGDDPGSRSVIIEPEVVYSLPPFEVPLDIIESVLSLF